MARVISKTQIDVAVQSRRTFSWLLASLAEAVRKRSVDTEKITDAVGTKANEAKMINLLNRKARSVVIKTIAPSITQSVRKGVRVAAQEGSSERIS